MRVIVRHETRYAYDAPQSYVVQRLHLTPSDFEAQRTLSWSISAPGIERALSYVDGFGNRVHVVTAGDVAGSVTIVAEGEVETQDAGGVVRGVSHGVPNAVFLRQTPATQPSKAMKTFAASLKPGVSALDRAHALMADLHARIAYELGSSHAHTTAGEAFADGRGVCQDHAHVLVGLARELEMPARYVTGYLVTGTGASSTAAHAWAELFIADLGWVGFDAANGQCPTEQYVRVAAGLDAAAVTPIKGFRRGGGGPEDMTVEVHVEIAQQ
jgi:transglutaminase-like putative cysteine protease